MFARRNPFPRLKEKLRSARLKNVALLLAAPCMDCGFSSVASI
jgi:hypothetical protein